MPAQQLQPRAWWFESCIQLHNAGRHATDRVDLSAGRIHEAMNWSDLEGLPLDPASYQLLQPLWWAFMPVRTGAPPDGSPAWVAFAQTSVNQAIVACALERFRLANRAYPETLDQLVPTLLARIPHDAVSGRPLIYQPEGNSSFLLRGVGPNGTDDRKTTGSDDWLWTYSTNTPSAKK